MPAKGDGSSTTKSAIAKGTVEIRSNPNQDITGLSRDTNKALNELGKIFDKKTVQEKQELANLFGELAYEEVGKLAAKKQLEFLKAKTNADEYDKLYKDAIKNGDIENAKKYEALLKDYKDIQKDLQPWNEAGINKTLLHSLIGGLMSEFAGNGFKSGAVSAGMNEAIQKELSKINDPDIHQWASVLIGVTAAKIVGGNIKAGGSVAASSTKNNYLGEEFVKETSEYIKNQCKNVIKDNINRLIYTGMLSNPEDMQYDYRIFMNGAALPIKFVSGSCGYILDKKGNVYVLIEADGGFGVSTPITITDGFGNFNAAKETREDYQNAIEGFSGGGGGAAGIQLTVSTSTSGIVSSEVTGTTSAGATLFSGRYVHYLFNLYDN